jgi:hypothetical protein
MRGGEGRPDILDGCALGHFHLNPAAPHRFTVSREQCDRDPHASPRGAGDQAWKEWPQPQLPLELGLLIEKPEPYRLST